MSTTLQSTNIPAGTWSIDPSHSEIGFTARHLMSKVRATFRTGPSSSSEMCAIRRSSVPWSGTLT